ncbi:CPSF A subunit region-domain-containing protein [Phanerochaete sordida]|uniref:CPSF A subunit region-domain-containing protein n=1 Tax=Phanerochaete sordida TaxID=48140 RepID=A0A9P3LJ43_9APHY|nr:CPSF A subunit region-domain-containing protein [Phanerochaete sordida]
MQALRHEILPPSGVEYAACLKLTPATALGSGPSTSQATGKAVFNVVVARSNFLRIFEVREEAPPISTQKDEERERRASVRKGTEAVEGEVEMDASGEGFVNMGSAKPTGQNGAANPPTVKRFYFIREHRLHGTVTGIESIRIVGSQEDGLDRLLVSFKDAKIALLEWSDAVNDLLTVSMHTYERAPQMMTLEAPLFRSQLRTDPLSRCAALMMPKDSIAVLPFYQSQADLDVMEQETQARDVPYSPSFVLDLTAEVDVRIKHVIDMVFLPGFNSPTVAVLFQNTQTWTSRLREFKDTVGLIIFTLDLVTRNCPVLTAVEGLPYDCLYLVPCSAELGGVVVVSANALTHVAQAAKRVILPVNGWQARVSDHPLPQLTDQEKEQNLKLEGSHAVFVDDKKFFLLLSDGTVYPVEVHADGRTVSRLTLGSALARTTIPTIVRRVSSDNLFIGSTVGPSVLLKTSHVEEEIKDEDVEMDTAPAAVVDEANEMDLDDDDDLYGPSSNQPDDLSKGAANGTGASTKTRTVVHLSLCDSLPAYGPISDITFSLTRVGDRPVAELVAATGSGSLGGFTLFQRDLPSRVKRKLHAIGGGRGMWSLAVRQAVKVNGSTYERPSNPHLGGNDAVILSTDANPSPGLSRIASRSAKNDVQITTRIPGTTIGAASFFQGTAILHVMSNAIRVLEPDGTERQIIKDLDGSVPRPKIRYCSICDPFILVIREDDSLGLFIGEPERGKIRRKDMSPMGEKTSKYIAGCFFTDTAGIFQSRADTASAADKDVTSTLQTVMNAGTKTQWLLLVRPQGVLEIWTLPKLTLVFSTPNISALESVLVDSGDAPAPSLPQDPPRKPQELDVEQIVIASLGETSPKPYLLVFLRCGLFTIYEALPTTAATDPLPPTRTSTLCVKFVKTVTRAFDIQQTDEVEKSVLAEQKRISRQLIPFVTSPAPGRTFSGVFLTGDRPCWILSTDKGGVKVMPSGHQVVHAFTSCSLWESKGDFLLYSDEGPSLIEWVPEIQFEGHLPSRSVPRSRPYSHVVFDPTTTLLVAASSLQSTFTSYDEERNVVWEPDEPNVSLPICETSTLELISPDTWTTMDGYEFAQNEFVTCMECVTLETLSTETGTKDFIAVSTTINRGEDLAVKGAVYIFEVVEVVPDPEMGQKRWYRLRLHCRDEAKGPVTALCGMDNYLVSSMGQKIFVRALDLDERLVGVAFLDVSVYVTSLRAVKNLLVIGDALKGVWLVAFQEDPYKLVVLAKDYYPIPVTCADLFFADGRASIISCDEEGVLRLNEYDPHDPESRHGQRLLCRTEFDGHTEYRTSRLIARRGKGLDAEIPQAKLICGHTDGSLTSLTYVDDAVSKRLHLLQGQLTRNVQHVAGLNPKAFRVVRNDRVARPLTKGILDGNLLSAFEDLPVPRQVEMTRQIATERATVLKDWLDLGGAW